MTKQLRKLTQGKYLNEDAVTDQREGLREARASPLFSDQTEARRAEKMFFGDRHLPPPPRSEGLDPPLRYDRRSHNCNLSNCKSTGKKFR